MKTREINVRTIVIELTNEWLDNVFFFFLIVECFDSREFNCPGNIAVH